MKGKVCFEMKKRSFSRIALVILLGVLVCLLTACGEKNNDGTSFQWWDPRLIPLGIVIMFVVFLLKGLFSNGGKSSGGNNTNGDSSNYDWTEDENEYYNKGYNNFSGSDDNSDSESSDGKG
jgi:hypothetical protein